MTIARKTSAIFASMLLIASTAQGRNYDCSKAGNANKVACKGNAPISTPTKSAMAPASTLAATAKPRNYDCTKLGNKFKAVCRGQNAVAPAPTTQVAAQPAMTSQSSMATRSGDKPTHPGGPNNATAMCKDGSYSHSAHHSGTCSGHQGVATWY